MQREYDVIVCGGGTAGFMAAAAAARMGAKTLIVERFSHLGGTAAFGIPFLGIVSGNGEVVNRGMVDELIERLQKQSASFGHARGAYWNTSENNGSYEFALTPFDPEHLKYVAQQMVTEAGGEILYYSIVTGAVVEKGRLQAIEVSNKSGKTLYFAKVFIDATGDADVAYHAGASFLPKVGVQNSSILFRIGSVDLEAFRGELERGVTVQGKGSWHTRVLYQAKAEGAQPSLVHMAGHLTPFEDKSRKITFTAVSFRDGEVFLNATRVAGVDGTDTEALSRAEVQERENVMEVFDALRKSVRGFENAVLLTTSPMGIRESRNIEGDYVITKEDVTGGKEFSDSVARGAYPIDIHDPKGGATQFVFIREGASYGVPFRAMLPKKIEGLIVAGRCISASHEAHGTVRIMGCVLAQGQAAGTAAGLCIQQNKEPRSLSISTLRDQLRKDGALL